MDSPVVSNTPACQDVTLLVVRPHPDDESSATGGMLAHYHACGMRTGVVTCTGGEAGELHDSDLDPSVDMPRLCEIRERELRRACVILGVAELRLLGYRDSGMPDTPANAHPDHIMSHRVSVDAFHAAGDAHAYPDAGLAWQVAKLYAIAHIDDGQWEALHSEFQAAGFNMGRRQRRRARRPGPETARVALDVDHHFNWSISLPPQR